MLMVSTHPDFRKLIVPTPVAEITVYEIEEYTRQRDIVLVGASGSYNQEGTFNPEYFIGVDNIGNYIKLAMCMTFFVFVVFFDEIISDNELISALDNEVKRMYV